MKKNHIIIISALVIGIALSVAVFSSLNADALHVNQVGADPFAYKGVITVTGIMAATSPNDPGLFGMVDIKELQCKSPNCNKLVMPVRHQGSMPKIGDEIRVTGSFVNIGNGIAFAANKIKVVRNHKIGG